jgi:DUF4097 and DUF4098 domain-containing protein YvlB
MVRVGPVANDRLYRNIGISYDVTVPIDTQVQARSGSGSQTITDVAGPVDAMTGSGSVTLRGIQGDVKAHTGSGGITISLIADGDLDAQTGSGGIDVTGARRGVRARRSGGAVWILRPDRDRFVSIE